MPQLYHRPAPIKVDNSKRKRRQNVAFFCQFSWQSISSLCTQTINPSGLLPSVLYFAMNDGLDSNRVGTPLNVHLIAAGEVIDSGVSHRPHITYFECFILPPFCRCRNLSRHRSRESCSRLGSRTISAYDDLQGYISPIGHGNHDRLKALDRSLPTSVGEECDVVCAVPV